MLLRAPSWGSVEVGGDVGGGGVRHLIQREWGSQFQDFCLLPSDKGDQNKPRLLTEHVDGVIAISVCVRSEVADERLSVPTDSDCRDQSISPTFSNFQSPHPSVTDNMGSISEDTKSKAWAVLVTRENYVPGESCPCRATNKGDRGWARGGDRGWGSRWTTSLFLSHSSTLNECSTMAPEVFANMQASSRCIAPSSPSPHTPFWF